MRCPMHMQHVNALITPVYWYFHCDFQQNIAVFCAISEFVLLLLFADASCSIQWRYRKLFFSSGRGREVTVETVVKVYLIPQLNRGSGERRKLLRGSGTLGPENGVWAFYA